MKKLLGIVLALALVLSLVTIVPAFAAEQEVLNIDWINTCMPNLDDVSFCVPAAAYFDFDKAPQSYLGNLSADVQQGATIIQFVGWYMSLTALDDVGIRRDGGEIEYDGYARDESGLNDAIANMGYTNSAYAKRLVIETPILSGTHKLEVVAKLAGGSTKVIYEIYYSDSDSVAVGKPVYTSLETVPAGGGKLTSDNVYWNPSFINDGVAPIFEGNEVPLGWYASTTTGDVDSKVYIDLKGIYDINLVTLDAMGFNNIAFPNTYKVYTSLDGASWTELGGESGIAAIPQFTRDSVFEGKGNARYILLDVSRFNLLEDGQGIYYGGIGELNVIGTKVADDDGRCFLEPFRSYDEGTCKDNFTGGQEAIGAPSAWTGFQTGDLDFDFSFRTDVSFYKIGFPAFWSFPGTPLTFEFYKDGNLVHSFDYVTQGDSPVVIDIGTTLPKGTYDVTITITDDEMNGEAYKCYLVLGFATDGNLYDDDYFVFERGNVAFDIYSTDTKGLGFVPFDYVEPHVAEKRGFDANAGDGLSYDQILINGTEIANGNAAVIAAKKSIDGTDGSVSTITLHGWYGNGNSPTAAFGYQINGGTIVYGDYFAATESAVTDLNANNRRFTMEIDVSNLKNENTIWVWAKLENGDEVKLDRFDNKGTANEKDREIYVVYNGPVSQQSNPPTADASIVIFMVAAAAIALVLLKKKGFNR